MNENAWASVRLVSDFRWNLVEFGVCGLIDPMFAKPDEGISSVTPPYELVMRVSLRGSPQGLFEARELMAGDWMVYNEPFAISPLPQEGERSAYRTFLTSVSSPLAELSLMT